VSLRICLEEGQDPNDVEEWVEVNGLCVSDLLEIMKAPNGQRALKAMEILTAKGLPCPLRLEPGIAQTIGLVETKEIWPLDLIQVTRKQTLASIQKRVPDMPVVDTYQTNQLNRKNDCAHLSDRFLALAKFQKNIRRGENAYAIFFLMAEIDDMAVFEAASDFGADVLPSIAQFHIKRATLALSLFTGGKVIPPFLVTYSGKKSFHCLWQLDKPMNRAELDTCKRAREYLQKKIKAKDQAELTEAEASFLIVDPQPLFSATALCRIPCQVVEPGRFPQLGWRTGHPGLVPSESVFRAAEAMVEAMGALDSLAALQRQQWAISNPEAKERTKVSDDDLCAAFPSNLRKARSGDGYAVRCPFHEDKTHSAFVSGNGFIYCSVCCNEGKKWVGRVFPGGRIEKSE
jgi:hypothetical protein